MTSNRRQFHTNNPQPLPRQHRFSTGMPLAARADHDTLASHDTKSQQHSLPNPKISTLVQGKPNKTTNNTLDSRASHTLHQNSTTIYASTSVHPDRPQTRSPSPITTVKIQQKCEICGKVTQLCCSLCRKVFYCALEHQEYDWHRQHKNVCEGRQSRRGVSQGESVTSDNGKFVFYSNGSMYNKQPNSLITAQQQSQAYERELQYQAMHRFLEMLSQRLLLRNKIVNEVCKINERTAVLVRQSLLRQTEQLFDLSDRITNKEYKPSYSTKIKKQDIQNYTSEMWGSEVVLSEAGVGLEWLIDMVLLFKVQHLNGLAREVREGVIGLGRMLEEDEYKRLFLEGNKVEEGREVSLSVTRTLVLRSIVEISQLYNLDKTTESVFKLFIKKVEQQEGIWEQIYAYFNIGVWYHRKTYYDKAAKSFLYTLQLLQSHKKTHSESTILKSDCLYNLAQAHWGTNQRVLAIQKMQECYRIRLNAIGKNSMEGSYCLYRLASWYRQMGKWGECLQYMEECNRVRRMYADQPGYRNELEEIRGLIKEVFEEIKREKRRSGEQMEGRNEGYYDELLAKEKIEEERAQPRREMEQGILSKQSVTSRLFRDDKQYVLFKVIISEEMWNTVSSEQAKHLSELIELTDKKLQKSEAIQTLVESNFVSSLTPAQRDLFFKQNQIGKQASP